MPLRVNPRCVVSFCERAFHTPYVMFAPTAVMAARMWMYFSTR
jgi:hypothetical protein